MKVRLVETAGGNELGCRIKYKKLDFWVSFASATSGKATDVFGWVK